MKKETILLAVILLIAATFRIVNLDYLSLWVDEYVHVLRANDFVHNGASIFTNDNNGVLLTLFISPFYALFESNEFWARFPSVLFGLASIFLIFKLAKSLFNPTIGLYSALLLALSQYHIFWSRIARNYAIFAFFMLVCLYILHQLYKYDQHQKQAIKKSSLLLCAFLAALLSHNLAFFLLFGYAFYIIALHIQVRYFTKKYQWNGFLTKYNLALIPAILLFLFILLPFFGDLLRPILSLFLPKKIVEWVVPNWDYLAELFKTKPLHSWNLYLDVLKFDYNHFYILGFFGFIWAILKKPQAGIFIFSFFIPILLLMSFIFREPVLPRYLIGIYPIFLISIAFFIDGIVQFVAKKIIKNKPTLVFSVSLLAIVSLCPISENYKLVMGKKHGRVVPKQLSHWNFANWKEPAIRVKNLIQENDILMSTNRNSTRFYLDCSKERTIYPFRQRKYDVNQHKYIPLTVENGATNTKSLQGIVNLFNQNERGWLFADYYFENVLTDPIARQFIIQNLNYHYDLGNEFIKVFSWDKHKPRLAKNYILEELGRDGIKNQSSEYKLNLKKKDKKIITLNIEAQGLDYNNELYLLINNKTKVNVNLSTGDQFKKTKNKRARQTFQLKLKSSFFREGKNTVKFQYNPKVKKEREKGCVIYRLNIS